MVDFLEIFENHHDFIDFGKLHETHCKHDEAT